VDAGQERVVLVEPLTGTTEDSSGTTTTDPTSVIPDSPRPLRTRRIFAHHCAPRNDGAAMLTCGNAAGGCCNSSPRLAESTFVRRSELGRVSDGEIPRSCCRRTRSTASSRPTRVAEPGGRAARRALGPVGAAEAQDLGCAITTIAPAAGSAPCSLLVRLGSSDKAVQQTCAPRPERSTSHHWRLEAARADHRNRSRMEVRL